MHAARRTTPACGFDQGVVESCSGLAHSYATLESLALFFNLRPFDLGVIAPYQFVNESLHVLVFFC